LDITALEKTRMAEERNKKLSRDEFKRLLSIIECINNREYMNSLEEKRWIGIGESMKKEQAIVDRRRNENTPGKSSVGYNILNASYLSNETGNMLKEFESVDQVRIEFSFFLTARK